MPSLCPCTDSSDTPVMASGKTTIPLVWYRSHFNSTVLLLHKLHRPRSLMLQRQIHYSIFFVIKVCLVCFTPSSTHNDNVCPFVILPLTVCVHVSIYFVLWGCFHVSITGITSPCPPLVSCHVLWLRRPGCLLKVGGEMHEAGLQTFSAQ